MLSDKELINFLNKKVALYNQQSFIAADPICVPHYFSLKQDIEIAGFFAANFAWGNRITIINKTKELMQRMDNSPYQFCKQHVASDLKKLLLFKHRTFNDTDLLYFISFLKHHYKTSNTLETAFNIGLHKNSPNVEMGLINFNHYFFSLKNVPVRTRKHIATPLNNSACKRLNMFLRWMVRFDKNKVDFGLWKTILPSQLICPLDVHVVNVSNHFGILKTHKADWKAALELTTYLKSINKTDPIKYDFALFSLGAIEKY